MKKKKIMFVVGARPNFMKVAPVLEAMRRLAADRFTTMLVHTGQHYDANMSDVFFADLEMPKPDTFLGTGGGSHAEQTAKVMIAMETLIRDEKPDLLLVAGDVNSTLASAIVAAKAQVPLGHIESGLRSFDREMPEEINRIVADEFSQFCFVTEPSGITNLKNEGIADSRVFYVGNTMIDSVVKYRGAATERFKELATQFDLKRKQFAVATLHRPSNVDDKENLTMLVDLFEKMSQAVSTIIFPVHPRTRNKLIEFGLEERVTKNESLVLIDPIGYLDFLALQDAAGVILTDSGGVQEETTALGVPCITLRENTERPSTIETGTNELVGLNMDRVLELVTDAMQGKWKAASIPALWDGKASERIVEILRTTIL
ncbi:MAG TPA: UDP-N-acetylglucosamine 2-epimerase (non-hydrolyzing) [Candidatus Kapabacteria bacterium]|nr:UDP-N-acetylglucosamine 2-epimerase (non-hydrolyzing) [Candidatus Kapabacteria bacterium]